MTTTLAQAHKFAADYWDRNDRNLKARTPGMMAMRALRCVSLLGGPGKLASTLSPKDGASLLVALKAGGLTRSSVVSYYSAFRRMLALNGIQTVDWPKAPSAPRQVRDPVSEEHVQALRDWLAARGWDDTAALIDLMGSTGLRVEVEALNGDWQARGDGRLVVHSGKGGHARVVPYRGPEKGPLRETLSDLTYAGHLWRWRKGLKELGLPSDLRPHDLRRKFVRDVYERSGKDIRLAQVLAGHSDPGTTAGYIGADWAQMEAACGTS